MEFSDLECDICSNTYSEDHHPRLLPCSHTVCGPCIDGLISAGKKECPLCRTKFSANSAADVAINRNLLNVARQLSSMYLASRPSTSAPKKSILEFTKDFRENRIRRSMVACQETEVEVKARIERNREIRKGLQGFIQTLEKMKLSSEKALSDIDQNNKELMNKLDVMQKEQLNMKESERKLETASDFASAGATMGEAGQILFGAKKAVSEIKQLLRENDRRRHDMKRDSLKVKGTFIEAMKDLERIIEELGGGHSVVKITVTDLRSPHGRLRGDAQRGIFAVMTFEGKLRLAPVKIESNNQVSFTHLEEGVLPPRCFVIELETLIPGGGSPSPSPSPPLSPPLPRGFLDLAYGSTPLGRVVIRVTVNGLLGLNFLHMCAGGMGGASYAHSRVSYIVGKGRAGEGIGMGRYVSHGGGGTLSTRAVLPSMREEDWEREWESGTHEETPVKAGDVRGNTISYEGASWFWIVTKDHPSRRSRFCFGMVDTGLDVLKSAILKYEDIYQVKVANCGLIL